MEGGEKKRDNGGRERGEGHRREIKKKYRCFFLNISNQKINSEGIVLSRYAVSRMSYF